MGIPSLSNQNSAASSSSSGAETGFGDFLSRGGGGSRAPVFNIATGASRLSASTGNSLDWPSLAIIGGILVGGLYILGRGK